MTTLLQTSEVSWQLDRALHYVSKKETRPLDKFFGKRVTTGTRSSAGRW